MTRSNERESTDQRSNREVIIAGGIAGLVSRFCIAPLDVVKIRQQLQPTLLQKAVLKDVGTASSTLAAIQSSKAKAKLDIIPYKGILGTAKTIARQEGISAFWKGNVPAELLYLTYTATQFYVYKQTHTFLRTLLPPSSPYHLPDPLASSIAGGTAGGLATSITYPLDLLRTRFAASKIRGSVYTSLADSIRQIYASEGVRGFYRGGGAAVAQIVPYMGLFFGSYETIRHSFVAIEPLKTAVNGGKQNNDVHASSGSQSGWEDALSGTLGGIIAKTGVFPLDTIRKRLQVQGPTRGLYVHGDIPLYERGILRCGADVVRREGWRGLYRGLTVSLIKAAPASAITMWTFERMVAVLRWVDGKD